MLSCHKVDVFTKNPYFSRSPQVFPHLWISITDWFYSRIHSYLLLSPYPSHLQDILSSHRRSSTIPSRTHGPPMSLPAFFFFFLSPSPTTTLPPHFSYSFSSTYNSKEKNLSPRDNVVRFKNKRNQPVVRNTRTTLCSGVLCDAINCVPGKVW